MSDAERPTADGQPEAMGEPGVRSGWNPDGVELAKALLARAKAASRPGAAARTPRSTRRQPRSAGSGSGWSGPGNDERDPKPLGDAVERLVDEHGWGEDVAVHGVVARWDQVVGLEVASHVAPERYADGVLTVRADSTAWATQVRMLAPTLVRRLNEEIGDGVVTRVTVLGPHAPSWRKGARHVPGRGPRDTYG